MHYLLLIHGKESVWEDMPPEEVGAVIEAVEEFDRDLSEAGQNLGSIRLQPAATGKVVRVRGGESLATDGPFAETKEQLGGIYVIEADDLDAAVGLASRMPLAAFSTIEVRPALGIDLREAVLATYDR